MNNTYHLLKTKWVNRKKGREKPKFSSIDLIDVKASSICLCLSALMSVFHFICENCKVNKLPGASTETDQRDCEPKCRVVVGNQP